MSETDDRNIIRIDDLEQRFSGFTRKSGSCGASPKAEMRSAIHRVGMIRLKTSS